MNTNKNKIRVTTIKCPRCQEEIYSRARHDYRSCSCKEIAIDGGFDYIKIAFTNEPPKPKRRYIKATRQELYYDWNHGGGKFGLIKK